MIVTLPAPRLLPITITTLSVLLLVKCGVLLQAIVMHGERPDTAVMSVANAADTDGGHAKPPPGQSPPLAPPPAAPLKAAATKAEATAAAKTPLAKPDVTKAGAAHQESPVAAQASDAAQREHATPDPAAPPISESERAILQGLRQRRQELDAREASVATRESLLAASETKLGERVAELQALQQKLEGLDATQKKKVEAGWQAMVKLFEAMKPRDAAAIFNDLAMPVLVQVFDRMKDSKAAAVMAAMTPDRAREVTAELAQMRTGRDPSFEQAPPGVKTSQAGG